MAKKSTEALGPAAAGSASYSPPSRPRNGVEVEFLIGCVVNGVPYAKGQKATINEQVAADLRLAKGIIVGSEDEFVMRTADAAVGERTADAAPARSSNDSSETMARGGGPSD